MERGIFLYPWDLLDNGIDETIRQLKGMKITYVSMALLYHQAKLLLPHNSKHHMYINEGGTCFYDFHSSRYGRLRPVRDALLDTYQGNFLKDAVARFHEAEIKVGAWIVVFHNDYLAKKYPDCALQNCYGESSPTNLCPTNPEVYEYGLKLSEEISELGIDELHLESVDYAGFLHGYHHEMQAYEDTGRLDQLLGVCYCPRCMMKAYLEGIDAGKLKELARQEVEDFLSFRKADRPEFQKLLSAYLTMRQMQIAAFYQDIKNILINKGLDIKVKPILWLAGENDPLLYGVDMKQMGAYVDGVIAAYPNSPVKVAGFVDKVRQSIPSTVRVTGGIRLMAPHTTDLNQVKEYVEAYQNYKIEDVILYNYGMAPWPFLKQLEVIG